MALYTVHADVHITRRKYFHMVETDGGEIIYRAQRWSEVLDFLYDQGALQVRVACPGVTWLINLERIYVHRRK